MKKITVEYFDSLSEVAVKNNKSAEQVFAEDFLRSF